jgi:hypothetical protein
VKLIAAALRSFLRFCFLHHLTATDLSSAVLWATPRSFKASEPNAGRRWARVALRARWRDRAVPVARPLSWSRVPRRAARGGAGIRVT